MVNPRLHRAKPEASWLAVWIILIFNRLHYISTCVQCTWWVCSALFCPTQYTTVIRTNKSTGWQDLLSHDCLLAVSFLLVKKLIKSSTCSLSHTDTERCIKCMTDCFTATLPCRRLYSEWVPPINLSWYSVRNIFKKNNKCN